jgi:hypothetical protein
VLEEHFSDEDVMELADLLTFLNCSDALEVTFSLEELSERFLTPLRAELEREGIALDPVDSRRGRHAIAEAGWNGIRSGQLRDKNILETKSGLLR